jgi:hypothetical protein
MPNKKTLLYKEFLRKHTTEDIVNKMSEEVSEAPSCPPAAGDVDLNTKNRNSTIKNHMYGPLNVDEPADYWEKIADKWDTSEEAAKKSLCGNCVAFDISPRMKECMPGPISDKDGHLGYCWMHHFKCHSARTCDTWAKGGPIVKDTISTEWQDRAGMSEDAPANSVAGGGVDMAPNARHPLSKSYLKYKKDNEKTARKLGLMVKEDNDNNNVILKSIIDTMQKLDEAVDKVSGVKTEIQFEEEKEYKTFSQKFNVGKNEDI